MKWSYVISVALIWGCDDHGASKLAKVRDDVCACKTPQCAESALEAVPKQDIVSDHRSQRIAREMLDCLAELYAGERPDDDPDAAP